jgi:hypothetical protein
VEPAIRETDAGDSDASQQFSFAKRRSTVMAALVLLPASVARSYVLLILF